jgi:hypothetical protein
VDYIEINVESSQILKTDVSWQTLKKNYHKILVIEKLLW